MSGNAEEEKESQKVLPLDLAKNQITTVRTVDGKTPLVMTNQSLRNMRVLTQASSSNQSVAGQTIITTNIIPQAVLKPGDVGRTQLGIITSTQGTNVSGNLTIQQRPAQITLSTAPLVPPSGTYHVPRGPAVVANLAAPRSNVATVRTPMVVSAQSGQAFIRPPRTPSPAQGTAWLTTNSSNGSQIKGATTVLSPPMRGPTVKPQLVGRSQVGSVSTLRPGTILQNAIIAQPTAQIHSFKPGTQGIQTIGGAVTLAQVLPNRTQAVVYNTGTTSQFSSATRITVANTIPNQRQPVSSRPIAQVTTARLTVPVNVSQSGTRLVTPQTVLTSGARISTVSTPQQTVLGSSAARIVSTQPNVRLSVAAAPAVVSSNNLLGQTRISTLNLHSLVAVAGQQRNIQAQGPKVITQPQGTIHLTSLQTPLKTTQSVVSTSTRTINVPAAIVTQRQATVVPSQAISIAKVFSPGDSQPSGTPASVYIHTPLQTAPRRTSPSDSQPSGTPASVYIHTPLQTAPRRTSPSPTSVAQTSSATVATTVATYSLPSGAYFYEAAGNVARSFSQQPQQSQQIRPNTQIHGVVANQPMRFNSVMVVEQNRTSHFGQSQQPMEQSQDHHQPQVMPSKTTSSPRPSILRKRDHDGSPLKASKNLAPVLASIQPQQSSAPLSPPSRPDSRGNGHSSGGSTTISATSSPGLAEVNEDSMPLVPMNNKEEEDAKPPMEMSPRKKPRKQQLTGSNDLNEHNDDMQFISENNLKREREDDSDGNQSDEPRDGAPEAVLITPVRKPASASLLNSYRQTWKATHNHYLRYSDVRPKDERRPSIMDLANQYRVQEKVNGWKIHHLSTQMEDLAEQEQTVYNQLIELLKCTESEETSKNDKDVNRINELIKGNLQRIKIINDGMIEAKTQIMKIFDHKVHVTDIINRCASKRNFKKREKS